MATRILIVLILSAGCATGPACARRGQTSDTAGDARHPRASAGAGATRPVEPPSTQPVELTGKLRGGMMAIGGETTGWTLVGDAATGGTELDVSAVKADAERLDGQRVTVTGRMEDRRYVERGTVRVLRVERIEAAR